MFQRFRHTLLSGLMLASQFVADGAFATPDVSPLSSALESNRYAIHLDEVKAAQEGAAPATASHYKLSGPGAARLADSVCRAQFVLIGEDHGFADVAVFTRALHGMLAPLKFDTLVLEIGNVTVDRVETALKGNADALVQMEAANPSAIPFLNWTEEARLVADLATAPNPIALLGVDQEFIMSTGAHFARLVALAPDEISRTLAKKYLARDTEATRLLTEEHDPSKMLLPLLDDSDFSTLRGAFFGDGPTASQSEATVIIDALAESAAIYRAQQTAPYASNRSRSQLMKRNFMSRYRELLTVEPHPRMLFKMGANHAGRGISPTRQFDLGSMVSEIAESSGGHSYHLLVVVAEGTVNRWLPFMPAEMQQTPYDGHAEFDALGAGPLIDTALADEWSLFDVAALRSRPDLYAQGGPAFDQLIHAYDAVLVIRNAQATRMLDE